MDEEETQVFTLGFNGGSFGENGKRQYDYFVPQKGERKQRRLLVFLGEAPKEYTMEGYENGSCEKPLEGVSAKMSAGPPWRRIGPLWRSAWRRPKPPSGKWPPEF